MIPSFKTCSACLIPAIACSLLDRLIDTVLNFLRNREYTGILKLNDAATALNFPVKTEGIAKTSKKLSWLAIITKDSFLGNTPLLAILHPNIKIINLQKLITNLYKTGGYNMVTINKIGPITTNVINPRK